MNNETGSLQGKKAMVIGGSRGIGAAVVKRLAREGAAVAFTYVSKPERARELVLAVEAAGGRAVALHADSADAAALERAIDEGAQTLGGLDVLVNNAGILIFGPVDTFSLEDFDKMLAINVRGVFVAAKAAARHLPQGGKILVVGSNTAERAMAPGSSIYGMTKAAVARLVRGLAWVRNANPQKRVADPDEIARFITYLARPESTYINGASLTIDGGFSA